MKKRISVIFGTRPEAIKVAPVILGLQKDGRFDVRVCVTGQHRQMLDQVLEVFSIKPDADLNLMRPNQTLAGLSARAIESIDQYLTQDKPNLVLVQGDTTTVFCAALASFYHKIPIGHIEAGLRTGNMLSPWPEEANRVLTTRLTELHFAPTTVSRDNLLKEGVPAEKITVTGNTVIDALFTVVEKVRKEQPEVPGLDKAKLASWAGRKVVLITGHRRENFGGGFDAICMAVRDLAAQFPNVEFVYPMHMNPNVREPVNRILGQATGRNVHLIEPLPYLPFIWMMDRASVILTDSGGVQEEAPSLGKPVLVMRDTTERPEAVAAGTVKLVGTDHAKIVSGITQLLTNEVAYKEMSRAHNPYGDGKATQRIIQACAAAL